MALIAPPAGAGTTGVREIITMHTRPNTSSLLTSGGSSGTGQVYPTGR